MTYTFAGLKSLINTQISRKFGHAVMDFELKAIARFVCAQPESMAGSRARALTLEPMGQPGGGGTFCLIISLILELSAYSQRVS